jgi:light-regulated signal transduction histidine kinase (bacteriophytochrome)
MLQNLTDLTFEKYLEMEEESPELNKKFQIMYKNPPELTDWEYEWDIFDPEYHSSINHEVRNSMNVIMGFAQILNHEGISKEDRNQYTGIICTETEKLLQTLIQLLNQLKKRTHPIH